jgi:hypothetical protein
MWQNILKNTLEPLPKEFGRKVYSRNPEERAFKSL